MEFDLNDSYIGIINLLIVNIIIFFVDVVVEEKFMYIFLKRCC